MSQTTSKPQSTSPHQIKNPATAAFFTNVHSLHIPLLCSTLLALALAVCVPAVRAQVTREVDSSAFKTGTIDGAIFPPAGNPGKSVAGITVTISETGQTSTTDKHGQYSFANVKPGTYTLVASAEGYSRLRITDVVVSPNHSLTLSPQAMPMVMKGGEIQVMAEVVVHANKDIETMQEYVVTDQKPQPFSDRNVDIPRGIDDAQPYYIFNSQTLDQSGATNVEDFLKQRLTMDTTSLTNSQQYNSTFGTTSSINLRGLGATQTLILIDGRRSASLNYAGVAYQPDLNGVPLSAIDRIEVLPSSAGAIYGGSAVGGVINVILKKDYQGGEIKYTYDNTWGTDAPLRTADVTGGFSLEGGKTHVMITCHYQDGKLLVLQDRSGSVQSGIATVLRNEPSVFYSSSSPFLGGSTTNIALRTGSYTPPGGTTYTNPTNLALTLNNGTSLNSLITYIPIGASPGSNLGGGLLANAGTYNLTLASGTGPYGLLNPIGQVPRTKSFLASVRRDMTAYIEAFADISSSSNIGVGLVNPFQGTYAVPGNAPTNPFQENVNVTIPTALTVPHFYENVAQDVTAGIRVKLPADWRAEVDFNWSQSLFSYSEDLVDTTAFGVALASGAINPFSDTTLYPLNLSAYLRPVVYSGLSTLNDISFRASGSGFSFPWGAPTITFGLEHRKEGNGTGRSFDPYPLTPANTFQTTFFGQAQSTNSGYFEALVPLVTGKNTFPLLRALDLQLAVRTEAYSVGTGTPSYASYPNNPSNTGFSGITVNGLPYHSVSKYVSTNPTYGLRYSPVKDLTFRASFGKGFVPPTYAQLLPNPTASLPSASPIFDPKTNSTYSGYQIISGGNPALLPARTHNLDAGVIWEPNADLLKGLRFNLEFYDIKEFNQISTQNAQYFISNESSYPGRVTRDPATGRVTLVDISSINLFNWRTDGWDISAEYRKPTSFGVIDLYIDGTVVEHYKEQVSLTKPVLEYVGYVAEGGPTKTKANATLTWEFHRWTVGWTVESFDGYKQAYSPGSPNQILNFPTTGYTYYTQAQGSYGVPSQAYHNVFAGFDLGKLEKGQGSVAQRIIAEWKVEVGVKNVFNSLPPFDAYYTPYYYSPYGDIRLRDYWISVRRSF